MGRRDGQALFWVWFLKLHVKSVFTRKQRPRRRGAPRRAGGIFNSHAQNVHGTVLDENRGRRRGPPWGAAAANVNFWLIVYLMICIELLLSFKRYIWVLELQCYSGNLCLGL